MTIDPARLTLQIYPQPILRERARPVPEVDDAVRAVIERMFVMMDEHQGIGLAAPQVGLGWRLFVVGKTGDGPDDRPRAYVNPELVDPTREADKTEEGCLSLPGVRGDVMRPVGITIHALDEHGHPVERTASGYEARVWQHEFDHLNGVLILDKFNPMDKRATQRVVRELEQSV